MKSLLFIIFVVCGVHSGGVDPDCEDRLALVIHENSVLQKDLADAGESIALLDEELRLTRAEVVRLNATLAEFKLKLDQLNDRIRIDEDVITDLRMELDNKDWTVMSIIGMMTTIMAGIMLVWVFVPWVLRFVRFLFSGVCTSCNGARRFFPSLWSSRQAAADEYIEMPTMSYQNEAILENSSITQVADGSYPACDFKIFHKDPIMPNQITFVGHGFWSAIGDNETIKTGVYMTAAHTVAHAESVLLMNANVPEKVMTVRREEWTFLDEYDIAYLRPTQAQTAQLAVRKAKVPKTRLRTPIFAFVYGRGQKSSAMVRPIDDSQNLHYEGSSVGGFSGSPYISGSVVFGIHLGSTQKVGVGVDAGFLNMKLQNRNKLQLESSEDFLEQELIKATKSKRRIEYRNFGIDDVIVDVRGREIFVDRGEFNAMLSAYSGGLKEVKTFSGESAYFPEKVSFEENSVGISSLNSDALPKNCQPQVPVLEPGAHHVNAVPSPLSVELPKLKKLDGNLGQSSDGQPSTVAQSSGASGDTLLSIMTLLYDLKYQHSKLEKKLESLSTGNVAQPGGSSKKSQKTQGGSK